ncbi:MAG TPA: polyprenol monophosphomannose synthase [Kiritimatiellia bacterium]|jgi:dolichol-phosphate mannosyltransferase|nr:polyprenol monophosphomannose synthase [Kiritimatiellia bacterium]HOM59120.1 polyprenol monophosphomannose synthase [Kiritimatiellia bacterium]HOR97581.1 polyprenol monophosphomannose synthase [Kiritimatiellia bacterium]HPW75633.1 polyprenol monophosphomannose synthase [Kiritimatiellia bacterium]
MSEKTLIIIPTYDERENVEPMSEAVLREVPTANILFVDDHSPDGTGAVLDAIAAREPRVFVMHRAGKEGLGRAYIAGFKWALERGYELICEMDCDFSHDPAALPVLLQTAREGADLVLGSRYIGGIRVMNWPMSRLLLSTGAAQYVKLITGMPVNDPTGGFKCFRRAVLEAIDLDRITSNGYSFQIEMTHTAWMLGFTVREVPITFEDRRSGYSKMRANIAYEAVAMVLRLWGRCGFRRSPRPRPREET